MRILFMKEKKRERNYFLNLSGWRNALQIAHSYKEIININWSLYLIWRENWAHNAWASWNFRHFNAVATYERDLSRVGLLGERKEQQSRSHYHIPMFGSIVHWRTALRAVFSWYNWTYTRSLVPFSRILALSRASSFVQRFGISRTGWLHFLREFEGTEWN